MSDDLEALRARLLRRRGGTVGVREGTMRWPFLLDLDEIVADIATGAARHNEGVDIHVREHALHTTAESTMQALCLDSTGTHMLAQLANFARAVDSSKAWITIPFRVPRPGVRRSGSTWWAIEHALLASVCGVSPARRALAHRPIRVLYLTPALMGLPDSGSFVHLPKPFDGLFSVESRLTGADGRDWSIIDPSGQVALEVWERRVSLVTVAHYLVNPQPGPFLGQVDGVFVDHHLIAEHLSKKPIAWKGAW